MEAADRMFEIRRALARYLHENPSACDSAAGIACWWLPWELEVTEVDLLPLLGELEDCGVVEKLVTADGHWFFRRGRADAALEALASPDQLH